MVRFLEEAAAETWAMGSLRQGLSFPFSLGYVSAPRVVIEGAGYVTVVGGATYGAYRLSRGDGR
jgi:hypothetical protein